MRYVVVACWLFALTQWCTPPVRTRVLEPQTPDRSHADAMARRAGERIATLQREAEALASQERTLLDELRRLEVDQQLKREELTLAEANRIKVSAELEATRSRLQQLESTARSQLPGLQTRFVDLYKLGRAGYMRMLLNASDLHALGRAYRTVSELARLDGRRAAEHRGTVAALRAAEKTLGERAVAMARNEAVARRAREDLDRAVTNRNQLVQAIDGRRDLAARYVGELQQAHQRLQTTLASGDARGTAVSLPIRPFKGALEWPGRGRILTAFGAPAIRGDTTVMRQGVEIGAPEGDNVYAVHDGRVAYADSFTGFGKLVIVEHTADTHSLYGYLTTIDVTRGSMIRARDRVGTVGRAPAGPAALYFELRIDGQPVDPLQWLKR